jgi:hypothetical protein
MVSLPPSFNRYYAENGVEALNPRLHDRRFKNKDRFDDPEQFYRVKVHASEQDVSDMVAKTLSQCKGRKSLSASV